MIWLVEDDGGLPPQGATHVLRGSEGAPFYLVPGSIFEANGWLYEIQRADYEIFMPNNESRAQTQILEAL